MERKIGEIFEYNGEWYQCLKAAHCKDCAFLNSNCIDDPDLKCGVDDRTDNCDVIFKKLVKIGEPVTAKGRIFQKLTSDNVSCKECVFNIPNKACCKDNYIEGCCYDGFWIEIKKDKKAMERENQDIIEVNGKKYKFIANNLLESCRKCAFYDENVPSCSRKFHCSPATRIDGKNGYFVETTSEEIANEIVDNTMKDIKNQIEKNMETSKLKPFDIELAKQGKQVCTRDGKEVRIVCFDQKGVHQPIVALVTDDDGREFIETYHLNGKFNDDDKTENKKDLMMIPEKKEGWVNLYKAEARLITRGSVYNTKDDAVKSIYSNNKHVATVKIEWEG